MRILSGYLKNRSLVAPKNSQTRPTSSKMRAQVFNICQHKIEMSSFLDLFAGSGAMGFEAISRGAKLAYLIDSNLHAVETIQKNRELLQLQDKIEIIDTDVFYGIKRISKSILHKICPEFELIFIDPPYFQKRAGELFLAKELLEIIDQKQTPLLAQNGWVFIEESISNDLETIPLKHLELLSKRKTGGSLLYQFQYKR